MKKEIFALLLLAALFAGGLYNTHYLRCMTGELSETLRLSEAYCENGEYEILIGSSSRDIKLSVKVNIDLPDDLQVTAQFSDFEKK